MSKGILIGLGFRARAGKDTVAAQLHTSYAFGRVAFANALKEGVKSIFKLSDDQVYGELKDVVDEFWKDTPRNIMQKTGTECMRKGYRDDLWVKCVERIVTFHDDMDWVVSDVRFPNEAEAIKKWGGKVIRLDRPNDTGLSDEAKLHASETSMVDYDGWDHIIANDGGLVDLHTKVKNLLMNELGWHPVAVR